MRPHLSGLIGRLAQSDRPRRYHDAPATAAISMPGPAAFDENGEETFVDPSSEQFREASTLFRMTKQAQEDGRKRTSIYGGPLRINKKAAKASQPRATFTKASHYVRCAVLVRRAVVAHLTPTSAAPACHVQVQAPPASSPSLNSHVAVSPPPVPHAARTPASRRAVERPSSTRAVPLINTSSRVRGRPPTVPNTSHDAVRESFSSEPASVATHSSDPIARSQVCAPTPRGTAHSSSTTQRKTSTIERTRGAAPAGTQ